MTTLVEVAAAAGVSTATASLVLSGKDKGRVSRKTAERVRLAADSMSYVRDALAGGMRNRRTRTIGVLGEQVLSTPYAVAMIDAILTASRELGWSVLLTDSGGQEGQTRRAVRELQSRQVDAIVHAAMYHQKVHVPPGLANVAVLNGFTDRDDVVAVVPDEETAGREATRHLIGLGHRRIAYVTDDSGAIAVGLRRAGYERALAEAGLEAGTGLVASGPSTPAGADAAARAVLDRPDRPTAVFCFKDEIAAAVYRQAARLGLRIPAELSVVGFDDLALVSTNLAPQLTTVRLPHYEMADWLVRGLIDRTLPDPPATIRFHCELVERASTAPPGGA